MVGNYDIAERLEDAGLRPRLRPLQPGNETLQEIYDRVAAIDADDAAVHDQELRTIADEYGLLERELADILAAVDRALNPRRYTEEELDEFIVNSPHSQLPRWEPGEDPQPEPSRPVETE